MPSMVPGARLIRLLVVPTCCALSGLAARFSRAALKAFQNLLAVLFAPNVCPVDPHRADPSAPMRTPSPSLPYRPSCFLTKKVPWQLGTCMGLGLILPLAPSFGAAARRAFDIPAGNATATLKSFAAQSGAQLLYSPDDVAHVRTQAVHGEFEPSIALARMLAHTPLRAREDPATKAIAITGNRPARAPPEPEAKSNHPDTSPNLSPNQPKDFSSVNSRHFLLLVAGWLAASTAASGQTSSHSLKSDDPIVLSPFTVSTERDTGFVAASSLAGGRLAGELRDTPVAYSVITRDFIDALGLDNVSDAAAWMPNTVEMISGLGGGQGEDIYNAPGNFNVRGSGAGRGQRNFFTYTAPNDSYAVERFDFSRGPNAILFGNGSLGGVATTTTKQARFDRAFNEVSQRFGSYNDSRTTVDFNRPLGRNAAIRLAGLNSESGGWRKKKFSDIEAAFLTASLKVSSTTTMRIDGEYGKFARNQTFTNLSDQFSAWDGKTTYSGPATTLPSNASALGIGRRGAGYNVYDPFSGQNAIMHYQNDPITLSGGANSNAPIAGYVQGSMPSFGSANSTILYAHNVPEGRFANALAGSAFRLPGKSFSLASDAPVYAERFKDLQFTVDQKLGAFYLQVAADLNRTSYFSYAMDSRGSGNTYIDINQVLPNGAPNPHFLQPYADAQLRRTLGQNSNNQGRFALGYAKNAGRWGVYTSSILGGTAHSRASSYTYNLSIAQNPDHRRWGASGSALGATDIVRIRRYWNEERRPVDIPASLRYVDPMTGIDRNINPIWALEQDRTDQAKIVKTRFNYAIAALNAKYFKDRFVLLGAVRMDDFRTINRQQIQGGDYSATAWDGVTPIMRPDAPSDWADLKFTPKDANGVVNGPVQAADLRPRDGNGNPLPQYANDRFKGDYNAPALSLRKTTRTIGSVVHVQPWLSAFANYAETFNNNAVIQRIDSSFLPPTVAKGIDLGIRMSVLNGRINAAFTRYTNEEKNASVSGAFSGSTLNTILNANKLDDLSPSSTNAYGLATVPGSFNDIRDRSAEGYEFEVVANITKHWRMSANFGLPKVYENNAYSDERAYFEKNLPTLRRIVAEAGAVFDSEDRATLDPGIPNLTARSPDVSSAVNAWNSLRTTRLNLVSNKRLSQDQRSVNFFTDYTFSEGWLRGLRAGIGVQFRGKLLIGYRAADTIVNPANPVTSIDNPNVDAYTPVYSPAPYYLTNATLGYTVRLKSRREIRFDLRANNLLNKQGPIYSGGSVLRPLGGDYTSPARETVPNLFSYRDPFMINLTTTLKF